MGKKETLLYPIIFMGILAIITTTTLSAIHFLTYETISQNNKFVFNSAIIKAAGYFEEKNPTQAEDFIKQTAIQNNLANENYIILNLNNKKIIVIIHQEPGLWGTIRAAVGFNVEDMKITNIEFIEQNETPGLGARITQEWFKSGVRGKSVPVGIGEGVPEQMRIDAVTGATVTTDAVVDIINNAHKKAEEIINRYFKNQIARL